MPMKLLLRNGEYVDCLIMFPSPRVICPLIIIMTSNTTMTMLNINLVMEMGVLMAQSPKVVVLALPLMDKVLY